ncbi:MAG: hypothetical protein EG825_06380 [Rhodocyclaceae bacterium]|nr:hypothetical protein [Rhodocyclaceae bacterium]
MTLQKNRRLALGLLTGIFLAFSAYAQDSIFKGMLGGPAAPNPVEDDAPWREESIALPPLPKEENLLEFYVSAGTSNHFYIDGPSIDPGKDGVVRYTLVIRTSGGATNVTHEGIRCETRELKLYATGTMAGTWSRTRKDEWRPIENKPVNRHHAALSRDLFCPAGARIYSNEEGREALRLGKHPRAI